MEFSGVFTVGATDIGNYDGTPRNRLVRITAHEVSHQWWYGVVGDDQVREPWLDEGLARFNELRYYEAYSPADAQWWWNTVIGTLRAAQPLNSSTSDFSSHGQYLVSIYNQGAVFLDDLRRTIGVDTFNAFLRDLYRRGSFRLITTQDFFDVLADHTRVNVQGLKQRYFR
jgi:aminopeptidase N